jgi:hypothetical protein
MKLVNLDKFKTVVDVVINGTQYQVRGITVGQFINGDIANSFNEQLSDIDRINKMIELIAKSSNIPVEVLKELDLNIITKLIQIMQGIDIEDTDDTKKKK